MVRVGLQKTSLVDYPGKVAAVFFMAGCNLRCPYCHNPSLVSPAEVAQDADDLITLEEAFAFLERRRTVLSGVVLSGGEPTMYSGLPDVAARIRSMGLLVKLDTNGTFPDRIAPIAADYVAMDLKTAPARYRELLPGLIGDSGADVGCVVDYGARIVDAVREVRLSGALYEFRITCAPGFFTLPDAEALAEMLRAEDPVYLQRYRPGRVLDSNWAARVTPYTDDELAPLLGVIRRAAPKARIRGF